MNNRIKLSLLVLATTIVSVWEGAPRLQAQVPYALKMIVSDENGGGDATISPDGKSFVTSLSRNGNLQLSIYEIGAGRWRQITTDSSDNFEGDWSPDGKRIVFTSTRSGSKNIFLINLDSGEIKQITHRSDEAEYPKFSPDGRHIVYTGGKWNERQFFIADVEDGSSRPITEKPSKVGACSFHPSGSLLVCHSYDSGTGHLLLQSISGSAAPLELTHGAVWDYKPTASPDGQWVAFSRSVDGPSRVWVMPFPAGDPVPLNPLDFDSDDRWPTWSHAGDKLLFHRLSERGLAVRILDRETGVVTNVVDSAESPGQASFDPTNSQFVYAALEGRKQVLRIRSVDGKTVRTVPLEIEAAFPRWAPSGKDIAFTCWNGERWDICTVRPDGSNFKNWTEKNQGWRDLRDPIDWSPDSTKIVFHVSTKPYQADLYVLDLHDGSLRNLTNDDWFGEAPSWSPDGKSINFMSTRGGNWTWGFFKLSLENGSYSTFAGPDYTQRNFPRANSRGDIVSSMYGKDGKEYLAESLAGGAFTISSAAGPGARWPSYSSNGKLILYTQIEHKVEYWVAENLTGPGSPLQQPKVSNTGSGNSKITEQPLGNTTSTASGGSGPVDVFHR
jgi:TolB protein